MLLALVLTLHAFNTLWWIMLENSFAHQASIWNFLFNGLYGMEYLCGGIIGMYYHRRLGGLKSTIGTSLFFLSMGMIIYSVGAFTWLGYNLLSKTELPYPSWADLFYSLLVPFFVIGLWRLLKMYNAFSSWKRILEFLVLLVIISCVMIFVVIHPDISPHLPFGVNFFNLFYPLGDSFLATLAIIAFRSSGGKMDKSILIFSAGLIVHTSADILFSYRNSHGLYWNGDVSDYVFACAGFMLSLGIVGIIRSFDK
ncbi:hypothetical protein HYS00_02410 [Candidatus Microgenomates bacterium]|nr:hypothetical protein [Candidatus Microgenomates bacterium]